MSKFTTQRSLAVEELGVRFNAKGPASIRLKGQWLKSAGFHPGQRVTVTCEQQGVLEIRLSSPLTSADFVAATAPFERLGI
jgi:hypothetical protein